MNDNCSCVEGRTERALIRLRAHLSDIEAQVRAHPRHDVKRHFLERFQTLLEEAADEAKRCADHQRAHPASTVTRPSVASSVADPSASENKGTT